MSDKKETQIYVRGRKHLYPREKIRYREVVDLGYPNGKHGPLYEYDVGAVRLNLGDYILG